MKVPLIVLACVAGTLVPNRILAQTVPAPASGAAPTTVEQLVALALDRAPIIQAQRLAIDRARAETDQAALRARLRHRAAGVSPGEGRL